MEKHLKKHFLQYFSQAYGTPFTTHPLNTLFDFDINTQFATVFLQGYITPKDYPGIPKEIHHIMEELNPSPINPPKLSVHITVQDLIQGCKEWKESALILPSGMHLGLYKIWLIHDKSDNAMPPEEYSSMYVKLYNKALSIGYPLSRWKLIHSIFILKE
eukprot:6327613-Ditylum_brightwellii.AAC.1